MAILLIRTSTGIVENILPEMPPQGWALDGHEIIVADGAPGDRWDGTQVVSPSIKSDQINAERDRRISDGFTYLNKKIQFDSDSQSNILGACQMASINILPQPFNWITADNSIISLTPEQVIEMGAIGAAHKQKIIFAARTLKDMNTIPLNYTDDTWWE